jgi:hypothetical protein
MLPWAVPEQPDTCSNGAHNEYPEQNEDPQLRFFDRPNGSVSLADLRVLPISPNVLPTILDLSRGGMRKRGLDTAGLPSRIGFLRLCGCPRLRLSRHVLSFSPSSITSAHRDLSQGNALRRHWLCPPFGGTRSGRRLRGCFRRRPGGYGVRAARLPEPASRFAWQGGPVTIPDALSS